MSSRFVVIGKDIETDEPVAIDADARARSTYLIGIQGTGKSTVLEQMAFQDIMNGDGLIFLDPHGDSVARLLQSMPMEQARRVVFWDPQDDDCAFGVNPFYCQDRKAIDRTADRFISALASTADFHETFQTAPRMKDLLHHLALAFVVNQGRTLVEAPKFLTDALFRREFYPALSGDYAHVREYWEDVDRRSPREQHELMDSSLNKLRPFQRDLLMRKMFRQPVPSLNFRRLMDERACVLVNLNPEPRLGDENASFLGAFIIFDILAAALSRNDLEPADRHRFHVIADEFQTYMSTAFSSLISEGRKFGVDVTVAHQYRAQITSEKTRGATLAVGNLVVFRVNPEDGRELAGAFDLTPPEALPSGVQHKYNYAPSPLDHIAERGHDDPRVLDAYRAMQEVCRELINPLRVIGNDPQSIMRQANTAELFRGISQHTTG